VSETGVATGSSPRKQSNAWRDIRDGSWLFSATLMQPVSAIDAACIPTVTEFWRLNNQRMTKSVLEADRVNFKGVICTKKKRVEVIVL
jgi:hypothetical protein